MASKKTNPDRPCSCGSGRKYNACHGSSEPLRSNSRPNGQRIGRFSPLTPTELRTVDLGDFRGFSSSALSELAGGLLAGISLSGMDLGGANFRGADLANARLDGCDLWGATFCDADLSQANLSRAQLTGADFQGATLDGTSFHYAVLNSANLQGTDLRTVDLGGTSLQGSNLAHANLRGSRLVYTDLTGATIDNSKWDGAQLNGIHLLDLDILPLTECTVVHHGVSHVDYRTIVRSLHAPGLKSFLQRTGMPEVFIEYMYDCAVSIAPGGVLSMLQSTFISYGGPDSAFAQKLNDALLKNGVTTFFFPENAEPGKKLHRVMREGVNQHERIILICSKSSLLRPGVLNEINETLQREARDGGKEYLIPITLDDYVFDGWDPSDPGLALAIRDRVVADFRGAVDDLDKFNTKLRQLVSALKKQVQP